MKASQRMKVEENKNEVLLPLTDFKTSDRVEESLEEIVRPHDLKQKTAESGGRVIWRCANGLMTVFFVMAVGVQFNDPDPYLWVPLYGTAAFLTVSVTVLPNCTSQKWWKCIYWIHAIFCTGMFFYVFVELIIVGTSPKSDGSLNPLMYEEGRELAGIMITVVWLFTCKQSPTIRCIFPRWCRFCQPSRHPEQINFDVLVDMPRNSLLVQQEQT